MVLNLRHMTTAEQKSMVLHDFGHALGMEHEHERSDFRDVLKKKDENGVFVFIIGLSEMRNGNQLLASELMFRNELNAPLGRIISEYDSNSITHYW